MNLVETYIRDLKDIRSSGEAVKETSYYPSLSNLLNAIGKDLKPKVRCIIHLKNRGAGIPDGGLFSKDQFQKITDGEPLQGQKPSRGVIEVKPTSEDAWVTADGQQVTKYWGKYNQVLVTNYRDFVLVGQDSEGKPVKLESYRLAESESAFWSTSSRRIEELHGTRFIEYIKRVMLQTTSLTDPKDVAWFLASYARDAKARIELINDLSTLNTVKSALEESLGLKFEGEKGFHFFRSTLIQTLFYGVFSAWVLWCKQNKSKDKIAKFDWHDSQWLLTVPVIKVLFEQIATKSKLEPLDLIEVLDWTASALNRVNHKVFFDNFEEGHAVQYFYEPFLQAFDPELRKDLGVWFTPPEIVQYMVARVDTVLKEELDIPDGLADKNVYVLDPCCGTGAYLVEVLKHIAKTLQDKGGDALMSNDLKQAAMHRVFGFEILPAPFVVAHLQLGLLLQNLGVPLSDKKNERAGVYLTNALTGWEPPKEPKAHLPFPEFEEERDAAEEVKRDKPILVILGNPPYNAFAGVSTKEEGDLTKPYKDGLISKWGIRAGRIDDLYIRFLRIAERRIAEKTGKGIVCYISNHSWISDPVFVVLRQHLLESFDKFWIENMHGDRKISEYAPDGRTSETIFAIPGFSVGIQQGVAISLWVKNGKKNQKKKILFRDDINEAKAIERRTQLLSSLKVNKFDSLYKLVFPEESNLFSFRLSNVSESYLQWTKLAELCDEIPIPGAEESRGGALIEIDKDILETRMKMYFDPKVDWDTLKTLNTGLTKNYIRFNSKVIREKFLKTEKYNSENLMHHTLRPFDIVWCYYSSIQPLWERPRPPLKEQCWEGNMFLITRFNAQANPEGVPMYMSNGLYDKQTISRNPGGIPLRLRKFSDSNKFPEQTDFVTSNSDATVIANLSLEARAYLEKLAISNPDSDTKIGQSSLCPYELIWMHTLAIGYSPKYLTENTDGLRGNWPRIPLPDSKDLLIKSAELGKLIANLLDTENSVSGITTGTLRPELKPIAMITKLGGGKLNPDSGELELTAGWGHGGKDGVTMPGKGKIIEREYTPAELDSIKEGAKALGLTIEQALEHLGPNTNDIYLNEIAFWKNIPAKVWDYTIGGYQVIKKWLSYREKPLLGRSLTSDEVRYVQEMARRITAILLLEPQLNENYQNVKNSTYFFKKL